MIPSGLQIISSFSQVIELFNHILYFPFLLQYLTIHLFCQKDLFLNWKKNQVPLDSKFQWLVEDLYRFESSYSSLDMKTEKAHPLLHGAEVLEWLPVSVVGQSDFWINMMIDSKKFL